MPRVLRALPKGSCPENGWNWCYDDEVILPVGWMCESDEGRCNCGCSVSFVGVDSRKATTHGRVAEVDDDTFDESCDDLRDSTLEAWDNNGEIADDYVQRMQELAAALEAFAVGDELCVERWPVDFRLIRQTK